MGYTLRDVVWLLDLKSTGQLSRWENGKTQPNLENLLKLCIIYRTIVDRLYKEYRYELRKEIEKREQLMFAKKQQKDAMNTSS